MKKQVVSGTLLVMLVIALFIIVPLAAYGSSLAIFSNRQTRKHATTEINSVDQYDAPTQGVTQSGILCNTPPKGGEQYSTCCEIGKSDIAVLWTFKRARRYAVIQSQSSIFKQGTMSMPLELTDRSTSAIHPSGLTKNTIGVS